MTIEQLDYEDLTETLTDDTITLVHAMTAACIAGLTAMLAPTPVRIIAAATALAVIARLLGRHLTLQRRIERLLETEGGRNAYLDAYGAGR